MRALLLAALALVGAGQATEDIWQITLKDGTIVWNLRLDSLRHDTIVFHQDKKTLRYPLRRGDEERVAPGARGGGGGGGGRGRARGGRPTGRGAGGVRVPLPPAQPPPGAVQC